MSSRSSYRALWLAAGLVVALGAVPAFAADTECALGSKAAPSELISACTAAIEQAANSPRDQSAALVTRADAHARTSGGLTQALKDLDRAIALDGRNARAYRLRGDLVREAGGDAGKATADLSMAISLDPNDAEAFELRGVVYTGQRRLDRALADYDQAIRLKPDYAQAYADRGVAFYLRGDNEKAVRDYDEAIRLDPDRPRTFTNRGAAYKKLGDMDKALADDSEAIRKCRNITTIAVSPTLP